MENFSQKSSYNGKYFIQRLQISFMVENISPYSEDISPFSDMTNTPGI